MCPRAGLVSPTALGGLKFLHSLSSNICCSCGGRRELGASQGSRSWTWGTSPGRTTPGTPGDVLPHGPEVCTFGQPCEHGVTPNACAAGHSANKAASLCSWGWAAHGPLSSLLRVRKGRGCESVCVAKRINTLLLCPINLSSVRGWLYPPVLQFNGFR